MKTDKIFYKMLLSQPEAVAELMPGIVGDCRYDFKALVVKEREFRLDGLLLPLSEDVTVPMVFFEAQMQPDEDFYGRYFGQLHLYLAQYKVTRPWQGLLILQNRSQNLGSEVPYSLLLNHWVTRLYLEDLLPLKNLSPNMALLRLIAFPEEEVVQEANTVLKDLEGSSDFQRGLGLVEGILVSKFPDLSLEEVKQMIGLKSVEFNETQFYKDVKQIGLEEGEANRLLRTLIRRFGALSTGEEAKVRSLSSDQLDLLGDAMFEFEGMSDLEAWLTPNTDN
jgi:predicted transposase YdaD